MDKTFSIELSRKIDELIGLVEWVKTDQLKKGGWERVKDLEDLERDLESASRLVERALWGSEFVVEAPSVDKVIFKKIYEYGNGIWEILGRVEEGIAEFAEKGTVPERSKVDIIRSQLKELIKTMEERHSILKGSGDLSD